MNRDSENLNITTFHTLTWENSFKEMHNISVLLGNSYEKYSSRFFDAMIEGFSGNDLYEINAGSTNPKTNGSSSEQVLISGFGRINYDFMQKYLFEANFRYDGSSKFAKGNRWGLFPSFSGGWRLEQENFMKNISWLSGLKLRASYGSLGNEQVGNFRYVSLMNLEKPYIFGGIVNSGAAIVNYNDPNISWETTVISNIGLDALLFNNKLNFSCEVYNKKTKDILRPVNLSAQVGNLGGPLRNIGILSNKGYELNLNHQNEINEFSYQIDAGISYNVNKVEELAGDEILSSSQAGQWFGGGSFITKEGYPIDSHYLLEAIGIFQTQEEVDNSPFQNMKTKPGYLKYKDQNGDKVIDQDDRVITGSTLPKYSYNFSLSLSYKNLSLRGFFNGVQDIDTYPSGIVAFPFWYATSVTKEWVNNSWTSKRTDAKLPIMTVYEQSVDDNYRPSDFWLKDASYLRLKNLQISYSFPKQFIEKIGLKDLLLFINGQNIFTISKMKEFDPEMNILQGTYAAYPTLKTYTMGLNVTL